MATFYIQLEDRLLRISGDLTRDNIVMALGYTPSDFSGNFNDLIDNPLTQDDNGEFKIVDESGNIIAIVDSEGIHSIDFVAGDHKLSDKADKSEIPSLDGYATESWVENKGYAKQEDLDNIDFNTLKNTPFSDDEKGELNIVDEAGNIIAKIDADGIHSVDFITGNHKLTDKIDSSALNGYAKESWVTAEINKAATEGKVDLTGYATEEWVENKNYLTEHQDISHLANKDEIPTKVSDLENDSNYLTEHQDISHLASKEWVNNKNYATEYDLNNIDYGSIKNVPISEDETGELNITDESGNVGFKLNEQGLFVKDVIASNGKQLSTEDFTSVLKNKLEGLTNYDDTQLELAISTLRNDFDKLVSGDTTTAIKTFNEVVAFLDGIQDSQDLTSIIASIEQQIAGKMDKVTLAKVATSGSYNDLSNKPTIPSAVTESTVSGWGFTKNTGTYSKPSTGIPKTDLASTVQTSLSKADTALQSYTEQYKGTVTGVKINGVTKSPNNGIVDLGTIESSNSGANVQAVDTGDILDDVNVSYATTAYIDLLVGDINSVLESIINGGSTSAIITFSILDWRYQAEEGMTWGEWVESEYNIDGYLIETNRITDDHYNTVYRASTDTDVKPTDVIIANESYVLLSDGSPA